MCVSGNFRKRCSWNFLNSQTRRDALGNLPRMALKQWIRNGIPKSLVLVLGLAWLWMTWSQYSGQVQGAAPVDAEIVLQYYDRGLRFSEAGERGNTYERWMAGAEDEAEWLAEIRETIRDLYLTDLGNPGEQLLDSIALRLDEPVTTREGRDDQEYREEMKQWLLDSNGRAWDFELFLHQETDPEVLARYRSENDRLLSRAMWSGIFDAAILLIGLVGAGYCLFGRKREALPGSRVPDSWAATTLLGAFFLAELLLTPWLWIIGFGYDAYYNLGGLHDIYYLYDAFWRAFPAVFLAVLFLKNPLRILRVFRLAKGIDWLLLIASLAVLSLVDWLFYFAMPTTDSDPTDFIETVSPDPWFLISLLFSSVVLAPVFEEIVFRGFLFQGLKSKTGAWAAAVISSVLFAVVHTQYDVWGWISVGIMGMVACYLTHRTGSLTTAIAFHSIGNLLISLDVYLFYQLPI